MARELLLPRLCNECRSRVEEGLTELTDHRRRLRELRPALRRQKALAGKRADALLDFPPDERIPKIRRSRTRFNNRPLAEELLRRSRGLVRREPEQAFHLAELAREAALSIAGSYESLDDQRSIRDLVAQACAHQGNAHRMLCRWSEAEERFATALGHLKRGTGSLRPRAQVLSLYGSLLRNRCKDQEALRALEEAEICYHRLGEHGLRGRTMVTRAAVLQGLEQHEPAVAVLRACIKLMDPRRDHRLLAIVHHNLARTLCNLERYEEATTALETSDELFRRVPDDEAMAPYRLWTRAQLAQGLGQSEAAEELYRAALRDFHRWRNPLKAALVSLDLAKLCFLEERLEDLAKVVKGSYRELQSQDLQPEADEALQLLVEAAQRRQVALELIGTAARHLRRQGVCSGCP